MPETRPLYVFGYGSLMWRPDFPYQDRWTGDALGVRRRLCVWSAAYRGSPERPGLVFGLDPVGDDPAVQDATTRGVVYEVAPRDRRATIAYLFQRELIYPIYWPAYVDTVSQAGRRRALTFVVDRADPGYAGGLAAAARIAAIASGRGRAGWARDYLANALDRLEAMGAPEPRLRAELQAADALGNDPERLFALLDEGVRRRLDAMFELAEELGA